MPHQFDDCFVAQLLITVQPLAAASHSGEEALGSCMGVLLVWLLPIFFGVHLARQKGISPHWMWFGIHPCGAWVVLFVLWAAKPRRGAAKVPGKTATGPFSQGPTAAAISGRWRLGNDSHAAGHYLRQTSWCVLLWAIFWGLVALAVIVGSLTPKGVSDAPLGGIIFLSMAVYAALLVAAFWQYNETAKVLDALSDAEWARLLGSQRPAPVHSFQLAEWDRWTGSILGSLDGLRACLILVPLAPIPLFAWQLRLAQLCAWIGNTHNSAPLQQKAKLVMRNWWIALGEAGGLIVIGIILASESAEPMFFGILALMLFAFLMYCDIERMIALRLADDVLEAAAPKSAISAKAKRAGPILDLDDDNFEAEVLRSIQPVVVYFWSPGSAACDVMDSTLSELATECQGRVRFCAMNVETATETAGKYNVIEVPSVIVFKHGRPATTIEGIRSKKEIKIGVGL